MPHLKQLARQIFHETLAAIDIPATMQRKMWRRGTVLMCGETRIDLRDFEKLRVVAIGKAAHAMVEGLALVLAPFVRMEGVVSAPTAARKRLAGMKYFVGGHPVPNAESWMAAEAILALLKKCDEKTLVFFLLSGGGSALVELPLDPAQTLEDVQKLHRALVTCGAPIEAINTVRKHFSAVKGGRLAAAGHNATKVTLAVSDVPVGKEPAQCLRHRKPIPRHFETHIFRCYWEWMTCFIQRIARRKRKDSSPVATTRPMTGRWRKRRSTCWNSWMNCGKHTRGNG